MKKNVQRTVLAVLSCATVFGLAACGEKDNYKPYNYSNSSNKASIVTYESADYTKASYDEKTEILGQLEKHAVQNWMTGMTLFGNGGYVMYNPRIVKGSNTYVTAYGFGILSEGNINGKLDANAQPHEPWREYYHTFQTEDPGTHNYMDSSTSVAGDITGLVSSGYWDTFMNDTKTGYDWVNSIANQKPIAMNDTDNDGFASLYRVEVKVGSQLKYSTNSTVFSKYNDREVVLEDYLTPFIILHDSANGLSRGTGEGLATSSAEVVGINDYIKATKEKGADAEALFAEHVGIKTVEAGGKSYLEFQFKNELNAFYAMYYLNSSMYAPMPMDFLEDIAKHANSNNPAKLLASRTNSGLTPVDTFLSTGPYTMESWKTGEAIVLKKNPNYVYADTKYQIKGVHYDILTAAATDNEAALNEFLNGKLDAVGIPSTRLDEFRNDPRATQTEESSTFKLNFNTTDQETWNQFFGKDGSVCQTLESDYWKVEPAMNNDNFLRGFYHAFDRKTFAEGQGRTASSNFFANTYMSDPENGVSYNTTQAHKDAVAHLITSQTDEFGHSKALAQKFFADAANELITSGDYKAGDTIEIEIAWMYPTDEKEMHNVIAKMIKDQFDLAETGLNLDIKFWVGNSWSDVYYTKMLTGQFDMGFGSISGSSLDPLGFYDTLMSNGLSGFTLNWARDTSVSDGTISYDGRDDWAFDELWYAANESIVLKQQADSALRKSLYNDNGTRSVDVHLIDNAKQLGELVGETGLSSTLTKVTLKVGDDEIVLSDTDYTYVNGVFSYVVPKAQEDLRLRMTLVFEFTSTNTTPNASRDEAKGTTYKTSVTIRP